MQLGRYRDLKCRSAANLGMDLQPTRKIIKRVVQWLIPLLTERTARLDGSALMYALSGFQLPIVDGVGLVGEPAVLARQGKQHDVPLLWEAAVSRNGTTRIKQH